MRGGEVAVGHTDDWSDQMDFRHSFTRYTKTTTAFTCRVGDGQVGAVGQDDGQTVRLTASSCHMKTEHKAENRSEAVWVLLNHRTFL